MHSNRTTRTSGASLLVLAIALTVVLPMSAQIGGAGSIAGVVADPTVR